MDYNILIGGKAGQGVETAAILLTDIIHQAGLNIFSSKDYMSRIRGGHNFVTIRFSENEVYSHSNDYDLIISLDTNTLDIHLKDLKKEGYIIQGSDIDCSYHNLISLNAKKISSEAGNPRAYNSVLLGAAAKFFNLPIDSLENVFSKHFSSLVIKQNLAAFMEGYGSSIKIHDTFIFKKTPNKILSNSNEGFAAGAYAGGLTFYSAYPMTPATSIMKFLSGIQKEAGILVEQAEDEISAINMAIGASFAGARAMTGSSGGGFSLMVEGLGLSGITETPLVIAEVQRPGPATGLSTRTEQSDLLFTVFASQGEFPRVVTTIINHEDAFTKGIRALNLAEKYQIPVIVLSDQYLADAVKTTTPFDLENIVLEDSILKEKVDDYKRYEFTKSGVSPRLIPGSIDGMTVLYDSHEHNEKGEIVEDSLTRNKMMAKRMKKEALILENEVVEPEYFGHNEPKYVLVGFGSTWGALREVAEIFEEENLKIGSLIFSDIWPLPRKKIEELNKNKPIFINVEQNYTGQLANLISMKTDIKFGNSILKYDGRPLSVKEIYSKAKEIILND